MAAPGLALSLVLLGAASLLTGCVAPGSAMGTLFIKGQLLDAADAALADKPIRLAITAGYGLGGLDHHFGHPEDYGHRDQVWEATTEGDGSFEVTYGTFVYHVSVWLLPPLGGFPRQPPPPSLYAVLPDAPEEVYLIGFRDGAVQYKVFDRRSRTELSHEQATWTIVRGFTRPRKVPHGKGLEVTIIVRRAT